MSYDFDIAKTGNLKNILKLWVGATEQLTDNLDVEEIRYVMAQMIL